MQTWLTIIIPVYNGARYIQDMAQAFRAQWMEGVELLFVNDGSTDDSVAILDALAAEGGLSARVVHQENAGVSAARNRGMREAAGSFIAFADVDDLVSPHYLQSVCEAVQTGGFDVLVFEKCRAKEKDMPFEGMPVQPLNLSRILTEDLLEMFLRNPTRYGVYNLLLSADYLRREQLRFAEGYSYYEDYDFFVRALIGTRQILHTQAQLYCYMLRENSAMMRFNARRLECMQLLKPLIKDVRERRPKAGKKFDRWLEARIYWSVLWQAAAALPSLREAAKFARDTNARAYLRKLRNYPDPMVWATAWLYRICPPLYLRAARWFGRRKSKVRSEEA